MHGCVLAVRQVYVRRLLPGVRLGAIALRAAVPVALASAPVWRCGLALWGGERTLAQALVELALWLGGLALATHRLESGLLAELRGYLRAGAAGVRVVAALGRRRGSSPASRCAATSARWTRGS